VGNLSADKDDKAPSGHTAEVTCLLSASSKAGVANDSSHSDSPATSISILFRSRGSPARVPHGAEHRVGGGDAASSTAPLKRIADSLAAMMTRHRDR
jgi:hypothetical protein